MTRLLNLGEWIREKHKSQRAFAEKLGVDATRLSRWLNLSDGISEDYKAKIRKLGYTGPWPSEEAQESPAPAGGPYVTEKDFAHENGRLTGRIEVLERAFEKLGEAVRELALREEERRRRDG